MAAGGMNSNPFESFECPECGLDYIPSLYGRKYHRKYHDKVINGFPWRPYSTDQVVYRCGLDRVLVVTPRSPIGQRLRAQETSAVMALDVPFSFVMYYRNEPPDERDLHIFLGARSDRLVAYLKMERREHIWHLTWPQYENHYTPEASDRPWMWSVGVAWVCRGNRRQGWIRRLIAAASTHLGIPPGEYGWFPPFSSDGKAMVRALHPESFFIAK